MSSGITDAAECSVCGKFRRLSEAEGWLQARWSQLSGLTVPRHTNHLETGLYCSEGCARDAVEKILGDVYRGDDS